MKYKVWHIERKEWIHDSWDIYIDAEGDVWDIEERGSYDRYMSKTWMTDSVKIVRFTGLKDKNGVEIYESDQLFASGNLSDELQYVGDVVWDELDARWEVHSFHGNFEYIPSECVVNGNIHELQEGVNNGI